MGKDTSISWCHHTFNAWWGCHKVSPGCTNCYAAAFDHRLGGKNWELKGPRRFFGEKHWNEPRKWNAAAERAGERRRVFCSSMADVFEDRPDLEPERAKLWRLIPETPHLDWLLLTKRPENFAGMLPWHKHGTSAWPNVWLGTTVEDQAYANLRIPELLGVDAAVRFLSCEPLLGPITIEALKPRLMPHDRVGYATAAMFGPEHVRTIDWVIVGCESGHGARACEVEWLRSIRDQCAAARVAHFLKQAVHVDGACTITDIRPIPQVLGRIGEVIPVIGVGSGSKEKGRGVIELPYLDGVQHAAFPEVAHAAQ